MFGYEDELRDKIDSLQKQNEILMKAIDQLIHKYDCDISREALRKIEELKEE